MSEERKTGDETVDGLDKLFRESLEQERIEPSVAAWRKISRRLLRSELARFDFRNLPGKIWLGIAGFVVVVLMLVWNLNEKKTPGTDETSHNANNLVRKDDPEKVTAEKPGRFAGETGQKAPTFNTSGVPIRKDGLAMKRTKKIISAQTNSGLNPDTAESVSRESFAAPVTGISPTETMRFSHTFRNRNGIDLAYLTRPGSPSPFGFSAPDTMLRFVTPAGIQNIPRVKNRIPGFFTFNFGVAPEQSFYRNATQYSETNYGLNAGLTYHTGKFSVTAGAGVSYVFDHGNYRVNYESRDSVGYFTSIISFTVTPDNKIIFNTKDIPVYDTVRHFADDRTVSRYTYVRIPLLVGYELLSSNRFSLGVRLGPSLSFLVGSKEADPFVDYPNSRLIRVDDNSLKRVKLNWEIQAMIDLEYRIEKIFSVYAQPYYKHYFRPFREMESISVADPYSLGIEVGARIHFGRKETQKKGR